MQPSSSTSVRRAVTSPLARVALRQEIAVGQPRDSVRCTTTQRVLVCDVVAELAEIGDGRIVKSDKAMRRVGVFKVCHAIQLIVPPGTAYRQLATGVEGQNMGVDVRIGADGGVLSLINVVVQLLQGRGDDPAPSSRTSRHDELAGLDVLDDR